MSKESRKLVSIMFTDMVGYSSLSQQNEKEALELLNDHRKIVRDIFPKHNGTEIKTIGDAFLISFSSALESVHCAIQLQQHFRKFNNETDSGNKILIRIGIHIGDVIFQDGDIYGDGVNIASRIEPVAEPGGICITEDVYRQIRNKIDLPLTKLDPANLKNIKLPFDLYKVNIENTKEEAKSSLTLDKYKIAVLPFDNYSPDDDSSYFSDGLTEELIMNLSRIKSLKVISRTTCMQYKNTSKDLSTIGRELNARYILEGSVRKVQNNIRITAQLIDVETDTHMWAETYKGNLDDVFEIQETVSKQIAESMKIELTAKDLSEISNHSTTNSEALDYNLRARELISYKTKNNIKLAIELLNKAIEIDPKYALAYAGLGEAYALLTDFVISKDELIEKSREYSLKAIMLDNSIPDAYSSLGMAYFARLEYDEAISALEKAIKLDQTNFFTYWMLGRIYYNTGQYEKAVKAFKYSANLNNEYYASFGDLVMAYKSLGETELADFYLKEVLEIYPKYLLKHTHDTRALIHYGVSLAEAGKNSEAENIINKAIAAEPDDAAIAYNSACAFAILGNNSRAITELKRAINCGFNNFDHISKDSDLVNLHHEPEFLKLIQKE